LILLGRWMGLLLSLFCWPTLLWAAGGFEVDKVYLTVGHGWAVVREIRINRSGLDGQEIELADIPPEADLSTLTVRARRLPVEMGRWSRVSVEETNQVPSRADKALVWSPREGFQGSPSEKTPPVSQVLRCRFPQPQAWGRMILEISYWVRNFDWEAQYQVAVRGEREDEKEPVSVDLTAIARIYNGCSRTYTRAVVQLAGADALASKAPAKEPGFLVLNEETPLSDLWLQPEIATPVEHLYPLPGTVDLPAHSDAQLYFAGVARKPAERLYVMMAEDFPVDSFKTGRPLKKAIVFKNDEEHGLGLNLPAGSVRIFLGGMRTHLLQDAWLPHTPAGGDLRMDLGWADNVRGLRKTLSEIETADGFQESIYELGMANLSGRDIRVEVREKPPIMLEWAVVRSSKPYRTESQRIVFLADIPSASEERIEYRLRIRKPKL